MTPIEISNTEKKIFEKLIKEFKGDAGHDIYHLKRVYNNAVMVQSKEGGDKEVILIAALMHDFHRLIQNKTGVFCSPKDSLEKVGNFLAEFDIESKKLKNILRCIEFHEEYDFSKRGKTVKDIETLILQDADNLDAIGAIGIARTFSFGGANNVPIWIDDLPFLRTHFDESEIDPSTIHHFYSKLLKLKDNMNTPTSQRMAEDRHKFMEKYLEQFFAEWSGKS